MKCRSPIFIAGGLHFYRKNGIEFSQWKRVDDLVQMIRSNKVAI